MPALWEPEDRASWLAAGDPPLAVQDLPPNVWLGDRPQASHRIEATSLPVRWPKEVELLSEGAVSAMREVLDTPAEADLAVSRAAGALSEVWRPASMEGSAAGVLPGLWLRSLPCRKWS